MAKMSIGFVLIALSIVIIVGSLAADVLGIGHTLGIGWKQLLVRQAKLGVSCR